MGEPRPLTVIEVQAMLAELHVPPASWDTHEPVQLLYEEFGIPADVCWGCSDVAAGDLVSVSFCSIAMRTFEDNGGPTSFIKMKTMRSDD